MSKKPWFPQLVQCNGGGRKTCLWNLFEMDQLEDLVLAGYCFELTRVEMRFVLWTCIWCSFCIPSSMLIDSSRAVLGSTVCLNSSFCISRLIKLVMKISLISVFSLFSKSQISFGSLNLLNCFSPKLFCDEKNVPFERYVLSSNEYVLHIFFSKLCGCKSVYLGVWIFAVENSAPPYRC